MLKTIKIRNFILIDELEIDLDNGFSVLTGETGAGKSIILDALLLALGERGNAKLIKNLAYPAIVTAIFVGGFTIKFKELLKTLGIDNFDNELILRRTLFSDGRSKAYINDIPVTNATLNLLREHLVEVCGQHESRGLLDNVNHIKLLDELGEYKNILNEVAKAFNQWQNVNNEYNNLVGKQDKYNIEYQYLKSLVHELQELNCMENEEQFLSEKRKILLDKGKVVELIQKWNNLLEHDALLSKLYSAQKEFLKIDQVFGTVKSSLERALSELEEFNAQIIAIGESFSVNDNINDVEDRLFKIRSVARKYNIVPNDIQDFLVQKMQELDELGNFDQTLSKAAVLLAEAQKTYTEKAEKLSQNRKKTAIKLKSGIISNLRDLKMDKVDFMVEISTDQNPEKWFKHGVDTVKFLIKTNPDSAFGELSKIASGGELSRIMLAIKVTLAGVGLMPTLVFDEIDTGISGAISSAIGKKLLELSKQCQILLVTHQPQVTAVSSHHLLIEKNIANNKTTIEVKKLDANQKLTEIARMISGEKITVESLNAARSLVESTVT